MSHSSVINSGKIWIKNSAIVSTKMLLEYQWGQFSGKLTPQSQLITVRVTD